MKSKIQIIVSVILFTLLVIAFSACDGKHPKQYRIAVVSIVEIDAITQLRKGFRERFEGSAYAKQNSVVITEYNAQGDTSIVSQIADKIATEKPDLVYALGTLVAEAIQKRAPDILIVQGAVTDPVAAGLARSWDASGKRYIATSDLPPIPKQVQLIRDLTPSVSRLGLIYNPGEANSVAVVSRLREHISSKGLTLKLVERPIANSAEAATAIQTLLGNVEAIYIPPDNTAHAAMPVICKFARDNKVPLYATVSGALAQGAFVTLSLDFFELGKESADLALSVIEGKDPANMPIRTNENPTVSINANAAQSLGIDITAFQNKPGVQIVQ